jgi:sRNA-binding protein
MNTNDSDANVTKQVSAIDRALAAAKARKAAAPGGGAAPPDPAPSPAERKAARAAALAEAKAARDARRAARVAAKAAAAAAPGRTVHMAKVERARSKCPPLSAEAEALFRSATEGLPSPQLDALAQHLAVAVRTERTTRALRSSPLPAGTRVRIVAGEARFLGATGTVVHARRLRSAVAVDGVRRRVYIYTGEAEALDG